MTPHSANGSIEDLIKKVRHGNPREREKAAEEIFKIYEALVSSYFAKKGVPREDAEDLTQDVFYRVFKSMDTFQGNSEAELKAWVFQISHNLFANYVRQRKARKRAAPVTPLEDDVQIPGPGKRPLEGMIEDEERERLESALQGLPEQMRKCCILRYVEGLKYKDIASRMGISIETVKAHLFQGRRRLSGSLRDPKRHGDQS